MSVERFTFVASGWDQVINAYKSIAAEASRTEGKVNRSFSKQTAKVQQTSAAQERSITASMSRREKMEERLHARVSKQREAAARKAEALERRIGERRIRAAHKEAMAQERANQRVAASRRRLIGRVGGALGGAALRGIGVAGAAGSLVLGAAARQSMALRDQSISLAVKGGRPQDASKIQKQLQNVALATPGAKAAGVGAGVEAFVSKTGDLDKAMAFSTIMAEISVASGTAAEDVGAAMADMFEKFNITSVEDMSKAMADLYVQGKRGSFELKDAAAQFPKIAAAASKFGLGGKSGLATLGGLTQLAKRSTGGGEDAATAVENLFAELTKKSDLIEKKTGQKVFNDKGKTQTNDIVDILVGTISGAKGNQKTMLDIFGVRGSRAVSSSVSTYNRAYAGAEGTEEQRTAVAVAALRAEIMKAIDATGSEAEVKRDLAAMQEQTGAQLTAAWESLVSEVMTAATPAMGALAKTLSMFIRDTDMSGLSVAFMALVEATQLAVEGLQSIGLLKKKEVNPVEEAANQRREAEAALGNLGLDEGQRKAIESIGMLEDVASVGGGMSEQDLRQRLGEAGVTPEQYQTYRKYSAQQQAAQDVVWGGGPSRQQTLERVAGELDRLTPDALKRFDVFNPVDAARRHLEMVEQDPSKAYQPGGVDIPGIGRIGAGSKGIDEALQAYAATLDSTGAKQGEAVTALATFTEAATKAAAAMEGVGNSGKPSLFSGIF